MRINIRISFSLCLMIIVAFGDNIHSYLSTQRTTTLDHLQSMKDIPHVSYIDGLTLAWFLKWKQTICSQSLNVHTKGVYKIWNFNPNLEKKIHNQYQKTRGSKEWMYVWKMQRMLEKGRDISWNTIVV
jgi:hypothetical protein